MCVQLQPAGYCIIITLCTENESRISEVCHFDREKWKRNATNSWIVPEAMYGRADGCIAIIAVACGLPRRTTSTFSCVIQRQPDAIAIPPQTVGNPTSRGGNIAAAARETSFHSTRLSVLHRVRGVGNLRNFAAISALRSNIGAIVSSSRSRKSIRSRSVSRQKMVSSLAEPHTIH